MRDRNDLLALDGFPAVGSDGGLNARLTEFIALASGGVAALPRPNMSSA